MEPTAAGMALLAHAKALLLKVNEMQAELKEYSTERRASLRVIANTSAMVGLLPQDLSEFTRENPAIHLVIKERWSDSIGRVILAAEADIGIIVEGAMVEGLDVRPYRHDRIAVVMPRSHPLAKNPSLQFIDVLDHDIVALEDSSSMMRLLVQQAVVAGRTLRPRVQVRSFEVICKMVRAGLGVGFLPHLAAVALARGIGLAVRPLPEDWANRQMLICTGKGRANHAMSLLVKFLSEAEQVRPDESFKLAERRWR
jgi:DNA-binding transcriptional LysR family regulator